MPQIEQAAGHIAGVELKRLVADPWTVRRIRTPLMIVHDVDDGEVPISNGYAYTMGSRARVWPPTALVTGASCVTCMSSIRRSALSPGVSRCANNR